MVVGMLNQDAQPIGQQILAFSPIPKVAPQARDRQVQIAEQLTTSPYKNVLIEKVALRGRDGGGGYQEEEQGGGREGEEKQEAGQQV